jgi:GNAT superfamily N-acetyltransferase
MEHNNTLRATVVTTDEELQQIAALSQANNIAGLSAEEKAREGFVTWSYQLPVLQQLHHLSPSVIVKDGDLVAGYALVLPKEAAAIYPPLQTMLDNFEQVVYKNKPLNSYHFYVMGQVCVHPAYRGKGVFAMLYGHHKKLFAATYDFLLTEISTANLRSQRAHQKTGFRPIHTYRDEMGEWDVVVWEW